MSESIDISKLDKAEVLAALYNASKQQGMGFMQSRGASGMTKEEAASEIEAVKSANGKIRFDYLNGRVMKVEIGGDTLEPWLYDRDNGPGAAERALAGLVSRQERIAEGLDPEPINTAYTSSEAFHANRGG